MTFFVILAGYCAWMVPGVALCGLLSWCLLLTVGIAFFSYFPCLPFLLLTLKLRMKTTSSLTTAAMKLEIKTVSGSLTVTPWANYVFRVLSLRVVLSRFRHFGDIIAASHQMLITCSSQASDSKLLAPAACIIWVLKKMWRLPSHHQLRVILYVAALVSVALRPGCRDLTERFW